MYLLGTSSLTSFPIPDPITLIHIDNDNNDYIDAVVNQLSVPSSTTTSSSYTSSVTSDTSSTKIQSTYDRVDKSIITTPLNDGKSHTIVGDNYIIQFELLHSLTIPVDVLFDNNTIGVISKAQVV